MVLGLRSKHRKGISVQVDYIVHVLEIKPWPPSQYLRSVQSVVLQWENGDLNSGSLISCVGDAHIEFNESFNLPLTLCREKKVQDKFQKNYLEFHLYEPRRDKAARGQLLGTAIINLADYGIIEETLTIDAPMSCKKNSKNMLQPVISVKLQPLGNYSSNSPPKSSLSKQVSLDQDGQALVSESLNKENDDEYEMASFTDDDVSPHSSRTVASSAFEVTVASPSQNEKNGAELATECTEVGYEHSVWSSGLEPAVPVANPNPDTQLGPKSDSTSSKDTQANDYSDAQTFQLRKNGQMEHRAFNNEQVSSLDVEEKKEQQEAGHEEQILVERIHSLESKAVGQFSQNYSRNPVMLRSDTLTSRKSAPAVSGSAETYAKLKHVKSVLLPFEAAKISGSSSNYQNMENTKKMDSFKCAPGSVTNHATTGRNDKTNDCFDSKPEWDSKIQMLEEELREAAALEAALYSVIAEHGGSTNKVHAPARRLSRLYIHACKRKYQAKEAGAARAAVSGLVLVSKACGNDVPRLTFWLSNSIMLRAIVIQDLGQLQLSGGSSLKCMGGGDGLDGRSPKQKESSPSGEENNNSMEEFDDWENPETFIIALEKVEAWIFSRIVESVWWQTLTPHMQSTAAKARGKTVSSSSRKACGTKYGLRDQEQGNFSIELWKEAFKGAYERLCPIRAAGHECGCLPVLARLVVEQLVSRLDVAMFNAILRESAEEMPTDPVSDPISDPGVLPIPAGRTSFGAGAQLKNAIGSWSRWLTDLFGIEDNDLLEECHKSFKAFCLLNALSDLMMLPFEMLANISTRKEVCPILGVPLIKRVLYNFVPDEFCPDQIPESVFESLDSEDAPDGAAECVTNFPCIATPTVYSPPPAASLKGIIGEVGSLALQRSGSSVLRKSYTSDDELDQLDSPLTSVISDSFGGSNVPKTKRMPKRKAARNVVRYQLLREVWRDGE